MQCPSCGENNLPEARFCSACGARMAGGTAPNSLALVNPLSASSLTPAPNPHPTPTGLPGDPAVSPPESLAPGRLIAGRYVVEQRQGSGGMGEVWRALDQELDLPVALKVLPPLLARNSRGLTALKREATLLLRLTHPNICRLYTFHAEDGLGILVMELIDGPTLEQVLEDRPEHRMNLEEALPILRGIAEALDQAHRQSPPILHRDIKPANVMLATDGRPKLTDFGIAREIKDTMTRTTGQEMVGTLLYMSPEQFMGKKLTPAADLYSLAATFYECLAGHPPFHSGAISHQVLNVDPESLIAQGVGVPDWVDAAILKALAKKPEDRFASTLEFVRAVEKAPAPATCAPAVPAAAPSGPALVVAIEGPSDFRTLADAVRNVSPGGRIIVRPGKYLEGVVVDRPVEIVGEGQMGSVVIESSEVPCLHLRGNKILVRGLRLISRCPSEDDPKAAAVLVGEGDDVTVEGCDISSLGAGVVVAGVASHLTIRGCKVHDCATQGIVFREEARGTIENSRIFGNKGPAVAVLLGAGPTIRRCKINDGLADGLLFSDQAQGLVEDCEIATNQLAGLTIRQYANPTIRRCKIHDSRSYPGVSVSSGGQGIIEDCDIYCNNASGVAIRQGGNPTVRRCKIHAQPDQGGVLVSDQGQGTIEDCDIFGNRLAGVIVKEQGDPVVRRCKIHDSRTHPGVLVWSAGRGTFEDCDIFGNKLAGIESKEGGHPTVCGCRINRNSFHAFHIHEKGQATVTNCDLSSNQFGAWEIGPRCIVHQDGNRA